MKKPIFEFKNLVYNKNNMNILNIKKFEVHRSACYLFNGNMASGKTLLLDILSKNNKNYSGDIKYEGNDFSEINKSFKSQSTFKGKIGIFDIKDNKINHKLNFYQIDQGSLKEIF